MFTIVKCRIITFVNMKHTPSTYTNLTEDYAAFKDLNLSGRYLNFESIWPSLQQLGTNFQVEQLGTSALGVPIHAVTLGTGAIKILAWSQMHGNESTTTKAVMDLLNAFALFPQDPVIKRILENLSIKIIPMLNPDGANAYTRVNANGIDLNRDALTLQEKESQLLRIVFDTFKPNFCFNLHDQRSIFSAGSGAQPATISFLTPSVNQERDIVTSRSTSMKIIAAIKKDIQAYLPNQIGRYDDAFNPNCTGDAFQSEQVPTILFEAGHYKQDYQREFTREVMTYSILAGLKAIASGEWEKNKVEEYLAIPENDKLFYDVILRNAIIKTEKMDVAIQFREELVDSKIDFVPVIEKIAPSLHFYGHREIDCEKEKVQLENYENLGENVIVNKVLKNNEVLIIKFIKN